MADNPKVNEILLVLAVKLAQPGQLSDVEDAYRRLQPPDGDLQFDRKVLGKSLHQLLDDGYIWLYAGRRYMLTREGERYVATSGLRIDLDMRRLYLLKETRMRSVDRRSDTHEWPLKQRP